MILSKEAQEIRQMKKGDVKYFKKSRKYPTKVTSYVRREVMRRKMNGCEALDYASMFTVRDVTSPMKGFIEVTCNY